MMADGFTVGVLLLLAGPTVVLLTYVGYPAMLVGLVRLFGKQRLPPDPRSGAWPSVTVAIAAYDEQNTIADRLTNLLALDYPRELLNIVVGSDGSADRTDAIVASYSERGVQLLRSNERCGKASMLNRIVMSSTSEIVAFSDANTRTAPDAIRKLARWFEDPGVGVVCGKLELVDRATGANADGLYWRIETALKSLEAQLDGLIGANGANYAVRRRVYVPLPSDTIVDDLVLPLLVRLKHGSRIVFDAEAVATEETAADLDDEFQRRARIGAGGFQAITLLWRLLDPRQGWLALTFFGHKVLRWICPLTLVLSLAANLALSSRPVFAALFVAQVVIYVVATGLARSVAFSRLPAPLKMAVMFHRMNLALLVGFWRWLSGSQAAAWQRTYRGERTGTR